MNNIDLRSTQHLETPVMEPAFDFQQVDDQTWNATIQKHTKVLKASGVCDKPLTGEEIDTLLHQLMALMDNRYTSYTMAYLLEVFGAETAERMTHNQAPWLVAGRDY